MSDGEKTPPHQLDRMTMLANPLSRFQRFGQESPLELQQRFLEKFDPLQQFHQLFDYLPGVNFFAKDDKGRLMAASKSMLKRFGMQSEESLIGRTDSDFFPPHIADAIYRDDKFVMESGEPMLGRVEVLFDDYRIFDWYVTNKLPLFGDGGKVIGVMGTVYSLEEKRDMLFSNARISKAVQRIQSAYGEKLDVAELAALCGLCERQFRRQFHEIFQMSPQEFIMKTRIQAASKALVHSDDSLSEIALESGFCDQSSFTQHFRRHLGVTPLQFRRRQLTGAK